VTSSYIQVTQCTRLRVALASLMTGLGYAVGADFTLQPVCRVNQASASRGWFYKVNLDMSAAAATALYETMWDESIGELGTGVAPFISSARVLCGSEIRMDALGISLLVVNAANTVHMVAGSGNACLPRPV
ncbi:hypothetical protein HaLaN_19049, partial [Haematococcus lacustris]